MLLIMILISMLYVMLIVFDVTTATCTLLIDYLAMMVLSLTALISCMLVLFFAMLSAYWGSNFTITCSAIY